ncbi:efflux RND transporter periplasmic adaptor subunit [Mangrovicella endophytica]|uniref:efflux RND transporter periplasmic adaptor subunit n=1 Tax=Mangrovicella endophytica TaxID=2066697 RepID=UPI000C9E01A2|nr:efflux RND transporter periplasmic adaptor subunit [Mangrovicella endophytica]
MNSSASVRLLMPAIALFLAVPAAAQMQAPPPPAVTVEEIKPQTVPITLDYAGRVESSREVEVRARVGGILLERSFDEGARVKQGDVLFTIDQKPYQAEVALAEAQLLQAKAQLSQAQRQQQRAAELAKRGATSTANLDDARSATELAEAAVAAGQARLDTANLSLTYATVQAPASGVTSLEQVPEGSLLNNGDLLTKITQLDPIYVNFAAADTEATMIRQLLETGGNALDQLSVEVLFGDGSTYNQKGRIDFTSSSIDANTGTILSRAVLPNPDQRLLPGQFVRVRINGITLPNTVVIPAEALMQSAQGQFVYTVDEKNLAQVAPVKVGRDMQNRLIVESGLKGGDRIITRGVIKARPNAPVTIDNGTATASSGAPADPAAPAQAAPGTGGALTGVTPANAAEKGSADAGPSEAAPSTGAPTPADDAAAAGGRGANAAEAAR